MLGSDGSWLSWLVALAGRRRGFRLERNGPRPDSLSLSLRSQALQALFPLQLGVVVVVSFMLKHESTAAPSSDFESVIEVWHLYVRFPSPSCFDTWSIWRASAHCCMIL